MRDRIAVVSIKNRGRLSEPRRESPVKRSYRPSRRRAGDDVKRPGLGAPHAQAVRQHSAERSPDPAPGEK